ncbi:molybdenum ABC transporter ATP-binding protein ModC [Shewanella sp. AS16]|uniref:molybdenum ABC transporter ATP-binding protein ModC n=1 Tax=Shewanella sp. AS16 TaxID=2907625 RepID=UPI001F2D06A5|nr:molybdenum ABC transporter ATP-binding protein ModC [Shewanella sp. AS16]MCE9686122.1 molybdenum ABC transporter ATP-binding protein ModC [Shewanella sp. AS16]
MLNIKLEKRLGDICLKVDASLPLKGVTAVFGLSGAGKSSLINMLAGLVTPDSGSIALGQEWLFNSELGINLAVEKRRTGYVFQDARLFPHYKVRGNLNYGNRDKDPAHFDLIVALLGLESLLERYPGTLSGGEKQRVAMGRALLSRPRLLLLDEPLASLDAPRKRELLPYLQALAERLAIPIIYVSHSLDEILQLADRLLVLERGQQVACGPLQQVWDSQALRPWVEAPAQGSLLLAEIGEVHPEYNMTRLRLGDNAELWVSGRLTNVGDSVRVRVHSQQVSVCLQRPEGSSIRNILAVTLAEIRQLDEDRVRLKLTLAGTHLWANITPWARDELGLTVGQALFAQIKGLSIGAEDIAPAHLLKRFS